MQRLLQLYIITLLSICAFCYDPRLLDPFHHSRFLFGSVFMLISSLIILLWKDRQKLSVNWMDGSITIFFLLNFLSITWANNFSEALFGAQKWLIFAGGYFICRFFIENGGDQFRIYLSRYSRILTSIVLLVVGWKIIVLTLEQGYSNESLYELKVLFGHKSLISGFLVLLLPFNLLSIEKSRPAKLLPYFLIAGQMMMILLLQSRSAYVALFVCLVIISGYMLWYRQQLLTPTLVRTIGLIAGLILILMSYFIISGSDFGERLNPLNYAKSQTATERRLVWIKTMDLVRDRPIIGVGVGNWKIELPGKGVEGSYRMQDQNVVFTRVHNDFLEVWSELGLIGLILFAAIFLIAFRSLWLSRTGKNAWTVCLLFSGLSSYIILSLIDFPKERIEFLLILGVYLAFVRSYSKASGLLDKVFGKKWLTPLFICLAVGQLINIYGGYYRYKGEVITKKLFQARSQEKWKNVIGLAEDASSCFYKLDPSTVPLAFYSGVAHYNLGDLEGAASDFQEARDQHPFNFHVINNQATIMIQQKEYEQAIPLLEEAIRINDRFEDALFNLAYCYYSLGAYDAALTTVMKIPGDSDKKKAYLKQISEAQIGSQ